MYWLFKVEPHISPIEKKITMKRPNLIFYKINVLLYYVKNVAFEQLFAFIFTGPN